MGDVKTTIELPDDLFRESKALAALRGESLKELFTAALRAYLEGEATSGPSPIGWRSVFGRAEPTAVREVDRILDEELGAVEAEDWR